jgi:hypothetical protein
LNTKFTSYPGNAVTGVVAGTVTASKAVVVDANKRVDTLVIGTLKLGVGAGTAITATAAEINKLAGLTTTADQIAAAPLHIITVPVANLSADADVADVPIFVVPTGYKFTITSAYVISQGTAAGIDDDNTCVVSVKTGATAIATETFDEEVAFPDSGNAITLTLDDENNEVDAEGVITYSVTNGTVADPPAFILQIAGILETAS